MQKKKKPVQPVYLRKGTVSVEEVIEFIPLEKNSKLPKRREYFGENVKLTSPRYKVFAIKGIQCAHCGLMGTFFALEQSLAQNTSKFHFNLYGTDKYGNDIMMTVDHIVPKSKGGPDTIENKQCLCFKCNNKKGDKLQTGTVENQKT